ncbi:Cell division cycle protein 20-like protein B [Heterocephalus glaber]|uniref:Cell division cycle protein 20-like protein B n=1 Tax=Heterocephalus glaber TaxID=10181 RepID=G5C6X4_HETGA|nr:Cell division cycle protein 20-like protein B [Heterocephalus glaber]
MEWKLERTARRRIRTEEEMLWENVMRVLAEDMKQQRSRGSPKLFDAGTTPYSNFKSNIVKRLSDEVPVASSPLSTRWQQSQIRDLEAYSFDESDISESVRSVLKIMPEKGTLTLGSYKEPLKTPVKGSSQTSNSALHFCKASRALERGGKENVASKAQNCLNELFSAQKVIQQINGKMQLCEESQCIWEDLNVLDWSFQNLVAVALGSAVYIWNGENHRVEKIDLSLTCNYVSSVSWIKKGTCLAVGTSEGEVQLWDVVTEKRLRNMQGHLSVVGALSWNHYILSSGSRLGRVYHHDVRAAQHQVGTLCHKQAVCALKWSPDGRLLSSGCSDGLLTIWPHDPGAHAQGQSLKVISQSTAVKICSLIWLPKTKEIATGQGAPKNDVILWTCPTLSRPSGFLGHRGRVLHLALSPDQTRVFSAAADGTACVWKCHQSPRPS